MHTSILRGAAFFLAVPLFFSLVLTSCRKNQVEDIDLPYAKKKYEARLWIDPEKDSSDAVFGQLEVKPEFAALLDSACMPLADKKFLSPFFWLESFHWKEEQNLWKEKQWKLSQHYLSCLSYRKNRELSPYLSFGNLNCTAQPPLLHKTIMVQELPLHLFYLGSSFENGQNPVVLMPYSKEMGRYLPPPEAFFETGGILAVLGERSFVTVRDSSRYRAKCDSLARLIWRDTARSSYHRHNYRAFKADSVAVNTCIKVSRQERLPDITENDLIHAANLLIADMYTTPAKIALLSVENGNLAAECAILSRKDLFTAAVLDIKNNISPQEVYSRLSSDFAQEPRPALLTNAPQWVLAAYLQDCDLRKTGKNPFLIADLFTMEDAWRFMLYHIAQEERIVE